MTGPPAACRLHRFAQSGNAYKVALMLELAGAEWTWDHHKLTANIATLRWRLNFAPEGSIDAAVIAFLRARAKQALKTLDAHLAGRRNVVADRPTIADFSLIGPVDDPTELGVDWKDYPVFGAGPNGSPPRCAGSSPTT